MARGLGRSRTGAGAAGLAARQAATGPSAGGLRGSRVVLRLAGMTVLVAVAAAILLVFSTQMGAFDPVIDSPSPGEPIGVWKGGDGATLVLAADGTFRASGLPAGVGDWADGYTPPSGRGRWHVGRFDDSTAMGVIFNFPTAAGPNSSSSTTTHRWHCSMTEAIQMRAGAANTASSGNSNNPAPKVLPSAEPEGPPKTISPRAPSGMWVHD
jgi:hypothetical protein